MAVCPLASTGGPSRHFALSAIASVKSETAFVLQQVTSIRLRPNLRRRRPLGRRCPKMSVTYLTMSGLQRRSCAAVSSAADWRVASSLPVSTAAAADTVNCAKSRSQSTDSTMPRIDSSSPLSGPSSFLQKSMTVFKVASSSPCDKCLL